jgi:hypothetical protein
MKATIEIYDTPPPHEGSGHKIKYSIVTESDAADTEITHVGYLIHGLAETLAIIAEPLVNPLHR